MTEVIVETAILPDRVEVSAIRVNSNSGIMSPVLTGSPVSGSAIIDSLSLKKVGSVSRISVIGSLAIDVKKF